MNIQSVLHKLIKIFRLATYSGTFEGVPYFSSRIGELKNHAAIALPGIGIFVHPDDVQNIALLRHELGHIIQASNWGKLFFYRSIAFISISSARKSNYDPKHVHQHTWTEWSANRLSYDYLEQPADWDMKAYPIFPPATSKEGSELPIALKEKYVRS